MNHRIANIRFIVLTFHMLLFFANSLLSQFPNIQVNQSSGPIEPEEVSITINPVNPLNLAAGANIDYYYYSMDGGHNWTEGVLTSSFGVWGDPSLTFDASGNLYFAHLSNPTFGYWIDRIVVQKSTNGGASWNDGVGVGFSPTRQQDKEWIVADMTNSTFHNYLYMAWTEFDEYGSNNPQDSSRIIFSRSTDSGFSWSNPVRISDRGGDCLDSDNTVEGAVPAIGPNGEIYVSWSGHGRILFDKSLDGGATFGSDIVVTDQPGGWHFSVPGIYRCNGFPVTACDVSNSIYRGNIYILWSDQRNGTNNTDIFLIRSTDGGDSWENRVKVNDDSTTRHQFFPWMTIDPSSGIIYIVFYDRRNTTGDLTDVFVARSHDGGQTFYNFQVSQSAFLPSDQIFFGDYTNIAALDGKIYPIWMRLDQTALSIWTALLDDSVITGIPTQWKTAIADFELYQNYPNPFNPVTIISYQLAVSGPVNLAIYNTAGQKVSELINGLQPAGKHSIEFLAEDLASGIYFYQLQLGNLVKSRKMVLLR